LPDRAGSSGSRNPGSFDSSGAASAVATPPVSVEERSPWQQIADFAKEGVRGIAANLNWDYRFNPFIGQFETEFQWYVDIGDLTYVRIVTAANPSHQGLYELPWSQLGHRKTVEAAKPIVIIRVDLTKLAALLRP